jgi:uncharacterized protein YbaR (Trm112 family)
MPDEIKSWIIQIKNGITVVVCPYCKHQMMYPDEKCEQCDKIVAMPKKSAKKEWW